MIAETNVMELFALSFLLAVLQFQVLHLSLSFILVNLSEQCKIEVQFHFFACGYSIFPAPCTEETVFSPSSIIGSLSNIT